MFCRSSPIIKRGARQRTAASWLRGPAGADGVLSPLITPTGPHGSVGTTKKPPRPFGRGGFRFFRLRLHHHRPRARPFDGSIPGGLVARRLGIRTREQRPSHRVEDLSHRSPWILDAGYGSHGSGRLLVERSRYLNSLAGKRFGVKLKKNDFKSDQ